MGLMAMSHVVIDVHHHVVACIRHFGELGL